MRQSFKMTTSNSTHSGLSFFNYPAVSHIQYVLLTIAFYCIEIFQKLHPLAKYTEVDHQSLIGLQLCTYSQMIFRTLPPHFEPVFLNVYGAP